MKNNYYLRKKANKALKCAKELESKRLKEGWRWVTHDGKTCRLLKDKT